MQVPLIPAFLLDESLPSLPGLYVHAHVTHCLALLPRVDLHLTFTQLCLGGICGQVGIKAGFGDMCKPALYGTLIPQGPLADCCWQRSIRWPLMLVGMTRNCLARRLLPLPPKIWSLLRPRHRRSQMITWPDPQPLIMEIYPGWSNFSYSRRPLTALHIGFHSLLKERRFRFQLQHKSALINAMLRPSRPV